MILQGLSWLTLQEGASRVNSIKAVYPSRQLSAASSMSLSPRLSSDFHATAAAAAAALASTTGLTPYDIAITAAENSSAKSSFVLPAPALPMSASAAASAAAQQPMNGAGLDELDPDMFVIKDLDSGKKYDLQQVSNAYTECTTCRLALLLWPLSYAAVVLRQGNHLY